MRFILLIPTILIVSFSFGQKVQNPILFEVKYNLVFTPDTNRINYKEPAAMILHIGQNGSCFQHILNSKKDSIDLVRKEMYESGNINVGALRAWTPKIKYRVFFDYNSNHLRVEELIISNKYYYEYNQPPIKWEISDETKDLYGFTCQKATTEYAGRQYVAWFTNKIPLQDGPYIFKGLPGLVMKLYDTQEHYVFNFGGISQRDGTEEMHKYNTESVLSNFEDVSVIKRLYRLDPGNISQAIANYAKSNISNYDEIIKKRNLANNNPMERNQ